MEPAIETMGKEQEEQILDLLELEEVSIETSEEEEKENEIENASVQEDTESEAGDKIGEKVTGEFKQDLEKEIATPATSDSVQGSELEFLKKQNQLLMEQLEKITERLGAKPIIEEKKEEKKVDELDLIGELDIDEVVSNKNLFNQVLNVAISKIEERIEAKINSIIPQVTSSHVNHAINIRETTENFYKENSDLVPVKKTVGRIAAEIYADEPTITLPELYKKAADKTREVLGIVRINKTGENSQRERKPEFATASRSGDRSKGKDQIDPVQQDIIETLGL